MLEAAAALAAPSSSRPASFALLLLADRASVLLQVLLSALQWQLKWPLARAALRHPHQQVTQGVQLALAGHPFHEDQQACSLGAA